MRYLIPLLLASQFMIFPALSFRWSKEISVQFMIILTLCSLIWKKNKPFALFIGWSIFSFIIKKSLVINDAGTVTNYSVNLMAYFNIINIVLYGLLYYILHKIELDRDKIYKTLGFIAVAQSLYVIVQALNMDQFFFHISGLYGEGIRKSWCVGLWANEGLVSWCIALCSPFLLAYDKLRFKLGFGICMIGVWLTQCTAGIAGVGLALFMYLWSKNRKIAIALLIFGTLTGGVLTANGTMKEYYNPTHRFEVWKKTIDIWKEGSGNEKVLDKATITGYGLGSFRRMFYAKAPEFQDDGHWAHTHNEYIQILFETGIVGLGLILAMIFITYRRFMECKRGLIPIMCLTVACFISLVGFPFHTAMGVIPIVALVMFEREFYGIKQSRNGQKKGHDRCCSINGEHPSDGFGYCN